MGAISEGALEARRLSTCSLENMTSADYNNLHPQVLGQLFDRILEYLQHDFEELVERLKEQVSRGSGLRAPCFAGGLTFGRELDNFELLKSHH